MSLKRNVQRPRYRAHRFPRVTGLKTPRSASHWHGFNMDYHLEVESLITEVHNIYSKCKYKPSNDRQFTILASFILYSPEIGSKVIALATGSKCLPESQLPPLGNALHDSHAEILARRGAIRWFYEELYRCISSKEQMGSTWIERRTNERWHLKPNIHLVLYISGIPCG